MARAPSEGGRLLGDSGRIVTEGTVMFLECAILRKLRT